MTNEEIIEREAILNGIMTEEDIMLLRSSGLDIPLHTIKGWKERGNYRIKKGEHGIETKLWKKRKRRKTTEIKENEVKIQEPGEFYLAKSYLYTSNQVELNS